MGRPNKGSSLTEKAFDNYSSSDYLAGFENGGSTHKYNIANVSKYALEKQTLSAGGKSGTVKSIIDGLTPRIKKTEDDITAVEATVAEAEAAVSELSGRVNAMESGPLVAATSSAMVDTTRIYVYTGEELGMTAGDWYYHNGTNWVSGGVYNAVAVNTDDTLSVEDVPADAKAAGDALSAMDEQKANVDGVYESMTVGNAEQVISTTFNEDSVPYNFRTAGGSADIGDRLYDKLVGGTVAFNQRVHNGNFADNSGWISSGGTTLSILNNIAKLTIDDTDSTFRPNVSINHNDYAVAGHKYLLSVDYKLTTEGTVPIYFGIIYGKYNEHGIMVTNQWQNVSFVKYIDTVASSYGDAFTLYISNKVSETDLSVGDTIEYRNVMCIDLTQMFGSAIADYIYSLEQTTAGAGVAFFRKLFPKPYYPYNAGELMSVEATAHKTVGFNAWDEEWELGTMNGTTGALEASATRIRSKNKIKIIPSIPYYIKSPYHVYVYAYDSNDNMIDYWSRKNQLQTFPENTQYIRISPVTDYGTFYNNDICINLSWSGYRDGEYEEYKEHVYPLDSNLTLRGIPKLNSDNELYYDGDTYESDGTVKRKYGVVDLGTLTWSKYGDVENVFASNSVEKSNGPLNLICSIYPTPLLIDASVANMPDGMIKGHTSARMIYIKDSKYSEYWTNDDMSGLSTALSGVYLVYELAEPTEETAATYQNPQVVDDFGTEEYVDSRTVSIPVGHETKYMSNLRDKLQRTPDSPDSNGDYIVRRTGGMNAYVPLVIPKELPNTPSEDGIYHLKVTVVNGAAGLSWESEA